MPSNCKHFPLADDHCLVCEEEERKMSGWNLPPGVTDRMIDEASGALEDDFSDLPEEPPEPVAPFWTVAIYLVDKVYGGPEEGGWWYDCGERVDTPLEGVNPNDLLTVLTGEGTILKDTEEQTAAEQEAHAYAEQLQLTLDATVNAGRREISSVLSTGRYYAQAYAGHPPAHFPETRPHYE